MYHSSDRPAARMGTVDCPFGGPMCYTYRNDSAGNWASEGVEEAMTGSAKTARIVRVKLEKGDAGLLFATSPDLKGFLVAERTEDALARAIPVAIAELYEACGMQVIVTRADDIPDNPRLQPWVAMPAEIARRALADRS
jgi:hypothetical protein